MTTTVTTFALTLPAVCWAWFATSLEAAILPTVDTAFAARYVRGHLAFLRQGDRQRMVEVEFNASLAPLVYRYMQAAKQDHAVVEANQLDRQWRGDDPAAVRVRALAQDNCLEMARAAKLARSVAYEVTGDPAWRD